MEFRWHLEKENERTLQLKAAHRHHCCLTVGALAFGVSLGAASCKLHDISSRSWNLPIAVVTMSQCHNYIYTCHNVFCMMESYCNHTAIMQSYCYVPRCGSSSSVAVFSRPPWCTASPALSVPLGFANWRRGRASLAKTLAARQGKMKPQLETQWNTRNTRETK